MRGEPRGSLVSTLVLAFVVAVVVRTFLFQPFHIPSESMRPTLEAGDYVIAGKWPYGYSRYSVPFGPPLFDGRIWGAEPERGDLAVFKLPADNSTDYIKRVVGLPGDRIQMINGEVVPREEAEPFVTTDPFGRTVSVSRYVETLPGGTTHAIIERDGDRGFWDNTEVFTVPQGHYFMMGDNRDNSTDSRDLSSVGFVPHENFVGRAEIVFFSIDEDASAWRLWEWPWTVRWERLLDRID